MQAVIDSLLNIFYAFVAFFKDFFVYVGSFFTAFFGTVGNVYQGVITYSSNVIKSLWWALIDLPLLVFQKVFDVILWLFQWASDSCSYCFGGAAGGGSLASSMQQSIDGLATYSPAIMYGISRSGVPEAFQILTCGVLIWSVFKIIGFIKAIL